MRYHGGTIIDTEKPPLRLAVATPTIEGSVTITSMRGKQFTLHRIPDKQLPARFYMTYPDQPGTPVLGGEDDCYELLYAVFAVEGDVLEEETFVTLKTDDGYTESHLVVKIEVHPPDLIPKVWMRDGRRGLDKRRGGKRRRKVQHA